MCSFDVTSLYLCLPHELITDSLIHFHQSQNVDTHTSTTIVQLTKICLSMNTFTFLQHHYRQFRGSPMVSPLSTIIAEIVMTRIDKWITHTLSTEIQFWRRYIDDIFCICKKDQESSILLTLDNYNQDISFTLETETLTKSLCFLPYSPSSVDIARKHKSYGIRTIYKNSPNLLSSLRHPHTKSSAPPDPLRSMGAVYSVSCEQCPATYVGETVLICKKKNEIEYLGHKINGFGKYPLEDKQACINNCPVPKNITELKSFLGFLSFYCKFLSNISDLAYPLYKCWDR
ncbi:hypothetical protein LAZ67_X002710 [Cordylochernes scorpioides]|uniref:Reverse transcriptase domain-containing protein n=1 Tax=Cordylochernes scorpioides TaxID=51811 RepID=A0ABY6LXP9_9ARAC|nr:hypothetical protein LAZ67_X002710 [Cordylochernes scorpioides]